MSVVSFPSGSRVMVLGGAGFVGSQLVRELLAAGCEVSSFDNYLHGSPKHLAELEGQIDAIYGDVLDEWALMRAFRRVRPRFVFNLIGDTYVPTAYELPKRFFRINVEGCLNALMACKEFDVERVLYVSSTEVYGDARTIPMDESHPLSPVNTYAVSKLAADQLCKTFHMEHGIPVVVARIFNCYGPRETEPYVIAEIITQLDKGPSVRLGNLAAKRDFSYVSDTARGLMALMASDIPNGEVANIGSGRAVSVNELALAIGRLMGHAQIDIGVDPRRLRRRDIELFECDSSKLHRASGWKAEVLLEEGLRRTIEWFRANGRRWVWEDRVEGS